MEIVLIVVAWGFLTVLVSEYAQSRGLDPWTYWLVALVFSPLIGFIAVAVAKPDATAQAKNEGKKKCPDCAEWVQPDARKCRFCGFLFAEPEPPLEAPPEAAHTELRPLQEVKRP